eukprot:TRINITY_DN11212_c0_g1_i1.p1 TRINITY_DN11212_c0_g1~~TRINITY_DN11212_c0_g1_i1.p1  ORF type:complete len:367 (-),score=93.24 TRINITY_DN11212_c0_g1_i1:58-1158(-)
MLSELSQVKNSLKVTETKHVELSAAEQLELLKQNAENASRTNVERWYEDMKDIMIGAHIFDCTVEQGKAIVKAYEHSNFNKDPITEQEQRHLDQLATTIETEVEIGFPGALENGFFIRLNTRSPKDAQMFSDRMKQAVEEDESAYLKETGKDVIDDNAKLAIVYKNMVKTMIVYSGKQAVDLLVRSHRIWQDISAALDLIIDTFSIKIVLREWAHIHPDTEFRGFVYGRTLNAISAYNRVVCWDGVADRKDELEQRMVEYWENVVQQKVPEGLDNFIVDFAFLENSDEITIVELNDFNDFEGCGANAELFDWQEDNDILTGNAPFEFRLVEQPLEKSELEARLSKPFRIWLGWDSIESWKHGIDYY